MDVALALIGAAWLAIIAMLLWGALDGLRKLAAKPPRLPIFGMLERQGLTLVQAEEVAGFAGVRDAAARCASCGASEACRRALRWGWLGFEAPPCPNAAFFARVGRT